MQYDLASQDSVPDSDRLTYLREAKENKHFKLLRLLSTEFEPGRRGYLRVIALFALFGGA